MTRRAALYLRVSTDKQTVENQEIQLRQVAERRGWEVVEVYDDAGISGSKGRADRPGLDQMLNDANRRHFDIVLVWAIDRLGRSLIDLLGTIQHGASGRRGNGSVEPRGGARSRRPWWLWPRPAIRDRRDGGNYPDNIRHAGCGP
jgi:Resolvase, N terminal domain